MCTTLERYKRVAEPPSDDRFVFPTEHAPSKYAAVRDQLATGDEVLEQSEIEKVIHENGS